MPTLATFITQPQLKERAGQQSYQRGIDYFHAQRCLILTYSDSKITAKIFGAKVYQVELRADKELYTQWK